MSAVEGYYVNDIRRHRLYISLLTTKESFERQSIRVNGPGRLGKDGGAKAVKG